MENDQFERKAMEDVETIEAENVIGGIKGRPGFGSIKKQGQFKAKMKVFARTNMMTILTLFGVIAGFALAFILRAVKWPWLERDIMYVTFVGTLFLNMLK